MLTYTDKPLLAGFTDDVNVEKGARQASLRIHMAKAVIGMTDNRIRGYWYGTSRLPSNALFLHVFMPLVISNHT